MTNGSINGAGLTSLGSYFLDPGQIYTRLDVPAARVALNGKRPVSIRSLRLYLAGRGASRTASVFAGGVTSDAFGISASGSAIDQGHRSLPGTGHLIADTGDGGTSVTIGFNTSGAVNFGRAAQGGNTVEHSNPAGGNFTNSTLYGEYGYQQAPNAPATCDAIQIGTTSARVTWATPTDDGGGYGLTGFRVQAALDDAFTIGVVSLDVGLVTQADLSGLVAGSIYRFRVLPRNACTTAAGTYGPASPTDLLTLVAATGNIDGWETFGVLPAGTDTPTEEGLRRGTVAEIEETPSALLKESVVTSPPVTLASDTYGAKRLVTGLTIGAVYRLSARAAYTGTAIGAETPNVYQVGILDLDEWAAAGTLATPNVAVDLPALEFTATATEHEIALRLAESVTVTGTADLERVAFWNIDLAEIPSFSPYRLQSIVYESSLANHFDLANNSVGGRWWVDTDGTTQFAAALGTEGPAATFTDSRDPAHPDRLEYTDLKTSFDTRNIVNDLDVTQHGEAGGDANDETLNFKDLTSIATNSVRNATMDMSLYDAGDYVGSLATRVTEIFEQNANPEFTVTGLTWNAQEDPELAARLDVYSAVDVIFQGLTYELRIVNMKHRISPRRWMIDLELDRR